MKPGIWAPFQLILPGLTFHGTILSQKSSISEMIYMLLFWPCSKSKLLKNTNTQYFTCAAAAAKSLQSCLTLCDPIDGSPPGSPIPGILQARILEWFAISFSNAGKWKVKVKSLSRFRLSATPRTAAHQAPLSMGFSRQECWSGVPLPSPHTHVHICNSSIGE